MTVKSEIAHGIATITIDRPERRNAVDGPTADRLLGAVLDADQNPSVSVVVLVGAGSHFCAGADLVAMTTPNQNAVHTEITEPGPMGPTRLVTTKPTIAAIEGYAVAGGLELACWCDLRVAASDATFGVFCRRWGVPLIDGGTVRLTRIVGQGRAMDMVLTGRPVGAPEAHAFGLVNRICQPGSALTEAQALARAIATNPQDCLRTDRASLLEQWSLDETNALTNELRLGMEALASPELSEGVKAFQNGAGRAGTGRS